LLTSYSRHGKHSLAVGPDLLLVHIVKFLNIALNEGDHL
jgi:hypothetical protein